MSFYECEKCGGIPGVTVCCTNERQAMTQSTEQQPVAYLWQHTITGQTKALMRDDVFTAGPHWRLVGPLFLATKSGQVVVPEAIEQMAVDRYKVVPSHESMLHRWAVVAGEGTQQLYIGREGECQNMARKFMGAFLDGAFVAMQNAAAPQIDWESAAEKIAIEVADNCGTVPNLTHPHIYLGLKKLFTTHPTQQGLDARTAYEAECFRWLRDEALKVWRAGPVVFMTDADGCPGDGGTWSGNILTGDKLESAIPVAAQAKKESVA